MVDVVAPGRTPGSAFRRTPEEAREGVPTASDLPTCWVLLRGLGREARHWFDFAEKLSAALGAPCDCIDLPGVGRARFERVPTSARATARAVASRLGKQFGVTEPRRLGILGLSFGGMVALELCRDQPDWFSHIVLVNSSSRLSPPWLRLVPRGVALVTKSMWTWDDVRREKRIYDLTSNLGDRQATEHAVLAARIARSSPVRRRTLAAQLAAAARFSPPEVWQPTLVLSSSGDRLVSPSCSEDLARHLGAVHEVHSAAGHDLPLDDPDWVVDVSQRWLASADARIEPS